jgi:hypothetical protein
MAVIKDSVTDESGRTVPIYIEIDQRENDPYADTRSVPQHVEEAFKSSMTLIRTCAEHIAGTVHDVPEKYRPHAVEVQLAIKVDAQLGAIIAKSSTEAQFQVTLRWGEKDQA